MFVSICRRTRLNGLLIGCLLGQGFAVTAVNAQTPEGWNPLHATCHELMAPRIDVKELARIEGLAAEEPQPTSGSFPPPYFPDQTPIEYAFQQEEVLRIDGIDWTFNDHLIDPLSGSRPDAPNFTTVAHIWRTLEVFTDCVEQRERLRLASLFTENGLRWAFSEGDPGRIQASPAAWLRDEAAWSRSAVSVPLFVSRAYQLSDDRVLLYVGEARDLEDTPEFADGSLWVLIYTLDGWKIDAMFGGLTLAAVWPRMLVARAESDG